MSVSLIPVPNVPRVRPGDDLGALLIAALEGASLAARGAGHPGGGAEGRLEGRGSLRRSWPGPAVAARAEPRRRGRQGSAARRGHPRRIAARGAASRQCADRRASPRFRHRQCRRRPVQRRSRDGGGAGAAAAARSGRLGRGAVRASRRAFRHAHRRDHQRQLGARVAARYRRRGGRCGRTAGADGPARPARSLRAHLACNRNRICRRGRGGGFSGDGAGGRRPAGGAGARPHLVAPAGAGRDPAAPAAEDLFR